MRIARLGLAGAVALAMVTGLIACGDDDDGGAGGTVIRGTTDQPVGFDPANVYDLPSWDVLVNIYQTLLTIPPGGNQPEPDAAESCEFTNPDNTTFECTIKDGLTFSDGSPLTAEDVVFSFERNIEIESPTGASSVLANVQSVEAPDDSTVVFELKEPEATFPYVISMQSFAIVPSDVFPADDIQPDEQVIGSGQYMVDSYEPGQQLVLTANPEYGGEFPAEDEGAIVQYFDKPSSLKLAVEQGDVDVAYRSFSPTDLEDLEGAEGLEVVGGAGSEIRYIVFNLDLQPGETDEEKLAIRRAVAYSIDRAAVAENVYNETVTPLYSMVPEGLEFAGDEYAAEFGEAPDPDAAAAELEQAGVDTPVPLELWYTPTHYGTGSADEYAEIERQLEADGLFDVTLESTEWNQYQEAALTDKYPSYQFGWYPDYPDADNYTASFWSSESFLNHHYSNPEIDDLIAAERETTDEAERAAAFEEMQALAAADAPTIPVWQGGQIAAVRDGVSGVEDTFDAAYLFRLWVITKD